LQDRRRRMAKTKQAKSKRSQQPVETPKDVTLFKRKSRFRETFSFLSRVMPLLITAFALGMSFQKIRDKRAKKSYSHSDLSAIKDRLVQAVEPRPPRNAKWVNDYHRKTVELEDRRLKTNYEGETEESWEDYLKNRTPRAFQVASDRNESLWSGKILEDVQKDPETDSGIDCESGDEVVIPRDLLFPYPSQETFIRIQKLLTECGYVYLDEFIPREKAEHLEKSFREFTNSSEADLFRYPCQVNSGAFLPSFRIFLLKKSRISKPIDFFLSYSPI